MRKYYSLTNGGIEQLVTLKDEWALYTDTINGIIEGSIRHDKNWIPDSARTLSQKTTWSWPNWSHGLFQGTLWRCWSQGEEELITSLGTPKEASSWVLSNLLDKKINEAPAQKNNRQILHIALLALLAAPIGIPLGIAILVSLFAILVAALTVILAFFAVPYLVSSADSYF